MDFDGYAFSKLPGFVEPALNMLPLPSPTCSCTNLPSGLTIVSGGSGGP